VSAASVLTGRTIEDIRAGRPPKNETPDRKRAKKKRVSSKSLPPFASIDPELATLVKEVPAPDAPFVYEIKYDGYRAMAWLDEGKVRIASRRGLDWTRHYDGVARALARVRAKTAIFDGEVAYVNEDGRTDFQKLQNALASSSRADKSRLVYFVFDLLFYDGVDLRAEPLAFRKDKLRTILAGEEPPLKMSDDVRDGHAFWREVCKLDLEGIVGKRTDRPYRSGRGTDWIKIKCQKRQEMVIVGFTPPRGTRRGIGAVLVAVHEGKTYRYAGKVGTGFSNATLRDLEERLGRLAVESSEDVPVRNPPPLRAVTWVKPELIAQVRFTEWTSDGALRHPSFEGLRMDKEACEVEREAEEPLPEALSKTGLGDGHDAEARVDGVLVSHPERVIEPVKGRTKLDLVRYMGEVAEHMLPFVSKRPLMLFRCPVRVPDSGEHARTGSMEKTASCFVQKHSGQGLGRTNLGSERIEGEEVLFATSERQLVTMAQNNAVEVHGWGSRLPRWDRPDWIVLDLDPGTDVPFARVVESAFETRDALRTLRLESWVKTTGGKGLHLVVPLARTYDWGTIRRASEAIAVLIARAAPERYVATMSKRARAGKIYIDYLRNAQGATAVLPYSPRARVGLTVALPVAWRDLRSVQPDELDVISVPKMLARRRTDPWADLLETKQVLPPELIAAKL
jgi:bifunctional non-homologous end joining protein LigD